MHLQLIRSNDQCAVADVTFFCMVAEIQEMFVKEEYRSKEIGKALVEALVFFAKSKSALQIEVTSNNVRENAHRFYQKEGFKKSHVKLVRYF